VRNMREARVSHEAMPTFHLVDRILFLQRHSPTGTIVEAPSDEDPVRLSHPWVWHGTAGCEYRGSSAIERSGRPPCFLRGKVGDVSEERPGKAAGVKTLSNRFGGVRYASKATCKWNNNRSATYEATQEEGRSSWLSHQAAGLLLRV
jgi:hypothetical protein